MINIFSIEKEKVIINQKEDVDNLSKNKLHWLRCVSPDEEDISIIAKLLKFDSDDVEDLLDFLREGERPRIEKEDFIEVVYDVPYSDNGDIITEPLYLFFKHNLVITIERGKLPTFENMSNLLKKNKLRFILRKNHTYLVIQILDRINDEFLRYVNRISDRTEIIASANENLTKKQVDAISSASTTLAFFNQSIVANIEVLNSLKKLHFKGITKDDREEFHDLYLEGLQILDTEKVQREVIMNIFNMQSIISNNNLNIFMKKLTALALIIMIPTLISGIYGMNIEGLPFAHHQYAFYIIIGFMTLITIIIYSIFRKIDWV